MCVCVCVTKLSPHKPATTNIITGIIYWILICALLSLNMEKFSNNILSTNDPFETKASTDDTGNGATPLFMLMFDFHSTER